MKDPIQKYFKIGVLEFMAYPASDKGRHHGLLETIKKIAYDNYFGAIELAPIEDKRLRQDVAKVLSEAHMSVCFCTQPALLATKYNTCDTDEEGRKKAETLLLEAVDEAEQLGAKGVAFLAGKWSVETKEQNYSQLLKTAGNVCAYAKTKGMMVELEVFDFDFEKSSLIGPAPYAAAFAADVRRNFDNFGLIVDLSHIPLTYETPEYVIKTLAPYTTHLHLGNAVCLDKNAEGYGDQHPRFGFPNSANGVDEVLEFLQTAKSEGLMDPVNPLVMSFEVKPRAYEDPDAVVAGAKRVLDRAWALLSD